MEQSELMEKLRQNPAALQRVMRSQDGQQLMRMLLGADGGSSLNRAAMQAAGGNTAEITKMIQNVMQSPEGAELIRRISESLQK
ncbi:MAG: hypothetical protein IIY16_07545 [Oscillospiraceae bacterium]|nr:hypothetical protein [Oscillospiraceae bacterium]